MASVAGAAPGVTSGDERFFMRAAIVIALIVVAGFSTQLAMGRSSFNSPLLVHAHAIVFMGWIALYLTQNGLVASDRLDLHRRLGWIAAAWMVPMVVLGIAATVAMVRRGTVPFFFQPGHFLVFNPATVLTFAALTSAAIIMRRRTDWHRRLHFCGTAMLIAPAFGRLIPAPLLMPWSYEVIFATTLVLPLIGAAADKLRSGRVHRAWWTGIGAMIGAMLLIEAISYSPVGAALYRGVTAGSPGARVAPLAFPPPPTGPRLTGRVAG